MIRRDVVEAGRVTHWVLISQIDHAHLSADLAEYWGAPPFAPLEPRDELLAAIYHHDDGWRQWEAEPQIDPQTGVPRAFTEMPVADALAIWRRSIAAGQQHGDLAGYLVAGHFSALLQRFDAWKQQGGQARSAVENFLSETGQKMTSWLTSWQSGDQGRTAELARRALSHLQLFDNLSLWFCCATRSLPETFETPGGPAVTISPNDPSRMLVSPWPYAKPGPGEMFEVSISGRLVPAARYGSAAELAEAESAPVELRWQLAKVAEKVDASAESQL